VACACATFAAKDLNYTDLATLAAVRAQDAACLLGDPAYKGQADFAWLHTLARAASGTRNLVAAERAANNREPHASTPLARQVLGMLTLTASLAAATLLRGDTAMHWFHEAEGIAQAVVDDPLANWQSFSTTNVKVWRVTVGVERGESGSTVLELAKDMNVSLLSPVAARYAGFLADGGKGLAREARTMPTAVKWLRQPEEAAPQRVRNSATARETVAYLLNRARADAAGRELRGLAARMGLPH
jgi:hypothetical protein